MIGLQQVQDVLERVLGERAMPFHNAFWRGKNREELVNTRVHNLPLFVPGNPGESHILSGLQKGKEGNKMISAYFSLARAKDEDLAILQRWIADGCPEQGSAQNYKVMEFTKSKATTVGDDKHVEYWRAIDIFFLPGLASSETLPHVITMHGKAFEEWIASEITGEDPSRWPTFLANKKVIESYSYIRHHQRRLIREYYGDLQENIFDSLWKFGGSLLPEDPQSMALPEHRMNGILDWFNWVPYLVATLNDPGVEEIDINLARAWQLGIIADGLLRTDDERPEGDRMPISDFSNDDPDLFSRVAAKYQHADKAMLVAEMVRRAKEWGALG
ncbi:hypothetical protein ABIE26_001615 [Pedobacter africanus]|uniref:Uncharacterized protein n=1 Tax=Pedobacter africanus TaxID=151894 RepID=A0ACC6KRQ7_9SPHI|nr:hypothetical protein [Pedobacter africanus]MDR6781896.1 hypothetical protein [Pedobacter africanus]